MPYSAIHIIFNPNSTGDSSANAKELKSQLKSSGLTNVTLVATKRAGHAEELSYELAKASPRPLIISASGDGGYNEVINGALKAQIEGFNPVCAVLASGNANDHSRTLQEKTLYESILDENETLIDVVKCSVTSNNGTWFRYAHSYIGLGLTPVVAEELNKTDLNPLKETAIVIKTFAQFEPFKIQVDKDVLELDSIVFSNIGEMAKVLTLAKDSRPDDGLFEVVIFEHASKLGLVSKIAEATVKGFSSEQQYSEYTLTILQDMPIQFDGEVASLKKGDSLLVTSENKLLRTIL